MATAEVTPAPCAFEERAGWSGLVADQEKSMNNKHVHPIFAGILNSVERAATPSISENQEMKDLIAHAIQEIDAFCDDTDAAWPSLRALRDRLANSCDLS